MDMSLLHYSRMDIAIEIIASLALNHEVGS